MLAFWILDPLYAALGTLLAWFYTLIPSFGISIILLTLTVRLLTFPLTAKQARSQQALQRLQPELKRLQAKYKSDRQKLNEEMMKFYKENKVNPFGGCLPLLLQAPVLIVLYRLIIDLSITVVVSFSVVGGAGAGPLANARVEGGQIYKASMENGVVTKGSLQDAEVKVNEQVVGRIVSAPVSDGKIASAPVVNGTITVGTLSNLEVRGGRVAGKPKHVPSSSSLFGALVESGGEMAWLGMDLSTSASTQTGGALVPYLLLIGLVVGTGYLQQRQITARIPKDGANTQMQMVTKIFPIFFGFISFSIPAGVVVYFATSNLWQIGQQWFMFRNQPPPPATPPDKKSSDTKKGPAGAKKSGSGSGKTGAPAKGGNSRSKGGSGTTGKGAKQPPRGRDGANQRGKNARKAGGQPNPGRNQGARKNPGRKNERRKDNE